VVVVVAAAGAQKNTAPISCFVELHSNVARGSVQQ
jgi:hypothetical protein